MAALTSYSEKLAPYAPHALAPTIQQVTDSDPHYVFFGVDSRSELSQLNSLYFTFFSKLKDAAIGKQLARYATEAIDGLPGGGPVFVVPAAAGAAGHGIARIPALSIATILFTIQVLSNDYTAVFNTLTQARSSPGFPGVASLFQLVLKDPQFKFKSPFDIPMDVICSSFISSLRPMLLTSNYMRMTALWYFMRDQNQAENTFLGTDALLGEHALPTSRTSNIGHLSGAAGSTSQQQLAAMQAFILDISAGVGGPDVLEPVFTEYEKFINLLTKHSDFQPVKLSKTEGGIPLRLINYQVQSSLFSAYSYLNQDEITLDVAELGTMFYKPESAVPAAAAPARRGGYFPIVEQNDLQTAIVTRNTGTVDVYWNSGANVNLTSTMIAGIYPIATLDKRVYQDYIFQKKPIPFSCSLPKTTQDYAELVRERLAAKRKADELYELERRTKIKKEIAAEAEASAKAKALDTGIPPTLPPDPENLAA